MRTLGRLLTAPLLLALLAAQAAGRDDPVQIHGVAVGSQHVVADGDRVEAHYAYSERGRGDDITARWKLDARGLPIAYDASGKDRKSVM